jgi:hypothetical protein
LFFALLLLLLFKCDNFVFVFVLESFFALLEFYLLLIDYHLDGMGDFLFKRY